MPVKARLAPAKQPEGSKPQVLNLVELTLEQESRSLAELEVLFQIGAPDP